MQLAVIEDSKYYCRHSTWRSVQAQKVPVKVYRRQGSWFKIDFFFFEGVVHVTQLSKAIFLSEQCFGISFVLSFVLCPILYLAQFTPDQHVISQHQDQTLLLLSGVDHRRQHLPSFAPHQMFSIRLLVSFSLSLKLLKSAIPCLCSVAYGQFGSSAPCVHSPGW